MEYTKREHLSAAGIGQNCIFHCVDGLRQGILSAVSDKHVTYRSSDRQEALQLCWNDIDTIEFELPSTDGQDSDCIRWWKEAVRTVKGSEFRLALSLSCQYRGFFEKLSAHDTMIVLQDILKADTQRKRKVLYIKDQNELQNCLSELERLFVLENASAEERLAARALVYFIAKDYVPAFKEMFSRIILPDRVSSRLLLPLICFCHEIRDSEGAFFWLMRYFDQVDAPIQKNSALWWGYLKYAVVHDFFPEVWKQIQRLSQSDPVLALRSMAFLFFLQGNHSKGVLLYRASCQPVPRVSADTFQAFYTALTHNAAEEDWGSRFYRYYLRGNQILKDGLYYSYEKDSRLQGYVYDFVESRGYCMVLGCDFITYFLHFDSGSQESDNFTPAIRRKLRQEITPIQSIRDESPVVVCFDRDRKIGPGKRAYHVTYATLVT